MLLLLLIWLFTSFAQRRTRSALSFIRYMADTSPAPAAPATSADRGPPRLHGSERATEPRLLRARSVAGARTGRGHRRVVVSDRLLDQPLDLAELWAQAARSVGAGAAPGAWQGRDARPTKGQRWGDVQARTMAESMIRQSTRMALARNMGWSVRLMSCCRQLVTMKAWSAFSAKLFTSR